MRNCNDNRKGESNNGSLVGNGGAGTPETGNVNGGGQSLPLYYNNSTAPISEATRTFEHVLFITIFWTVKLGYMWSDSMSGVLRRIGYAGDIAT